MRQTATQIVSTLEDTDATFHSGMPVTSLHEPFLVFVLQTSFRTIAPLWQDHLFHAQIVSQLFIRFGEETAIAAGLLRRLVEGFEMRFQAGFPLLFIAGIAIQDAVVAHQTAFDFVEPDFVSIFHRTRLLATTDNIGVLFKQAHDLFGSGNLFSLQDAASGLVDDLLSARQKGLQGLVQTFGFLLLMLGIGLLISEVFVTSYGVLGIGGVIAS